MKKAATLLNVALALPFLFFLLILGGGAISGSATAQSSLMYASALADVPAELREPLRQISTTWDADWTYLAAYVKEKYQWRVPVKTRLQRLKEAMEQDPCEGKTPPTTTSTGPLTETPPPGATQPPADCEEPTRPSRDSIEAAWRQDATEWLKQQVWQIWGVSDAEGWQLRPEDVGFKAMLRQRVNEKQWRSIRTSAELWEAWYQLRDGEKSRDFGEAVQWEDNTRFLSLLDWDYVFPVSGGPWDFGDSWGAERPQNKGMASERHHGTDIMAPLGTPLVAVDDCRVERKGWNYLGGWALTLRCTDNLLHYYAHMSGYAPGIEQGQAVKRGQVVGYVGNSGEGPEGTTGKMEPHLHYGLYIDEDWVTNPFMYLFLWDALNR